MCLAVLQVESLQSKVSELEEGMNKQQFEVSEHKVRTAVVCVRVCARMCVVCVFVRGMCNDL